MYTLLLESKMYTEPEARAAVEQVWQRSTDLAPGEGTELQVRALRTRYGAMEVMTFDSCGGGEATCYAAEESAVRYLQAAGRRYLDGKSWTPRDAKRSAHLTRGATDTKPPECYHTERAGRAIAGAPPLARGATDDDYCHGGARFARSLDSCSHGRADAATRDPPPDDVRDAEVPLTAAVYLAAVLDGIEVVGIGSAEYSAKLLKALPNLKALLGESVQVCPPRYECTCLTPQPGAPLQASLPPSGSPSESLRPTPCSSHAALIQVALVEVESAFDFKAITTHDLIAPHTISGLANAKLHAIMVKYRGVKAHAILAPVVSRGAGERSDVGALQPLLHACHEAHHDLFVSVLLAGGAGIRDIDFNLLRFETYAEQLRCAGMSEVPAVYRDPMALSPPQLGYLHSAALQGGAEQEQLSYYTMAQLKDYASKGQAARGARHAHPAPTHARVLARRVARTPRDATQD